jgi:hypothetical protein
LVHYALNKNFHKSKCTLAEIVLSPMAEGWMSGKRFIVLSVECLYSNPF